MSNTDDLPLTNATPVSRAESLPPPGATPLTRWVFAIAAAKLLVHLVTNLSGAYGYMRDELYYLACADHLAWGYVDHPPLSIALLWVSRHLMGDSLAAVRLLPALSGAATIVVAALLVREMGGRRAAQILAGCCAMAAPLLLGFDSVFSMNSFEILLWNVAFYLFVRATDSGETRNWVFLGLVLGLGLLNKISVLWLGAGLAAGIVLTPARRALATRGPWLSAAIAAVLFLPHVAWQVLNGYPTLEFIRNAGSGKYVALSPLDLLIQQTLFMNPLTLLLWLGGTAFFLVSRGKRASHRVLPIAYLVVFAILALNRYSKAAYLAPVMPMLFVLGALWFERLVDRLNRPAAIPVVAAVVLAGGVALAPFVTPVLPVETYIRYARALGMAPSTSEHHVMGRLPQHFADMFGWPEMARAIARAYSTLTPADRARVAILVNNYGEAGAVDFFGGAYGLPRAICGHNNYWLWGPRGARGDVVIKLGGTAEDLAQYYRDVAQAGLIVNDNSMPYESNLPVWICRSRRAPLAGDWAQFKVFN